jgi:hypothetical protein
MLQATSCSVQRCLKRRRSPRSRHAAHAPRSTRVPGSWFAQTRPPHVYQEAIAMSSGMDSNSRYRSLNCQTTALHDIRDINLGSRLWPAHCARCRYCTCALNDDAVSMRPARLNCRKMRLSPGLGKHTGSKAQAIPFQLAFSWWPSMTIPACPCSPLSSRPSA